MFMYYKVYVQNHQKKVTFLMHFFSFLYKIRMCLFPSLIIIYILFGRNGYTLKWFQSLILSLIGGISYVPTVVSPIDSHLPHIIT